MVTSFVGRVGFVTGGEGKSGTAWCKIGVSERYYTGDKKNPYAYANYVCKAFGPAAEAMNRLLSKGDWVHIMSNRPAEIVEGSGDYPDQIGYMVTDWSKIWADNNNSDSSDEDDDRGSKKEKAYRGNKDRSYRKGSNTRSKKQIVEDDDDDVSDLFADSDD